MRLSTLRLQNCRSCGDVTVSFDPYTCLVGPNGAGKSTILGALNVLFHHAAGSSLDVALLREDDFCDKDTSKPIEIVATFTHLSAEAEADLAEYVRHGELVIKARAVWDAERAAAPVKQYGARLVMRQFAPYFDADKRGAKASDLKVLFGDLRRQWPEMPSVSAKADMEAALRAFEEQHRDLCELTDSEDQFYGISRGANRLARHIQWVYVPAVKDAADEQSEGKETALGQLLQRTIRTEFNFDDAIAALRTDALGRYETLVRSQDAALAGVEAHLQETLQHWAHPGARVELRWNADRDKSVTINAPFARVKIGEGDFVGDVPRVGHGMQRAFIVAMLQQIATSDATGGPTLLLGFEEPELYQHPPQARHLSTVLEELTAGNAQVIVTTHSPLFVSGRGFEAVRMIRKTDGTARSRCSSTTYADVSKHLAPALGGAAASASSQLGVLEQILQPSQAEMFFCNVPVLVEGREDIAFLATYMRKSDQWREFRRLGGHFIAAEGKSNMSRLASVSQLLGVKAFTVFDGDGDCAEKDRAQHERDNKCLLRLAGCGETPFVSSPIIADGVIMWPTNIAGAVEKDLGTPWNEAIEQATATHDLHDVKKKNPLLIAAALEGFLEAHGRVDVLERATLAIMRFAAS